MSLLVPMRRRSVSIAISLLIIIVGTAYVPTLRNGFVNYDDSENIIENTTIRSLSLQNVRTLFGSFFMGHYFPLTMLSYAIDYRFSQLDPFAYHLSNLLLHLLNCLLVFWVFYLISGKTVVALLIAVVFGIHPLQVDTVAWASERKNVLYAFFYLGAIVSYLYYLSNRCKPRYYFVTLFLFVLSLLAKSMAVTLPLALLAVEWFIFKRRGKRIVIEKIPFLILSLVFAGIAIMGSYSHAVIRSENASGIFSKIMVASYALMFYLKSLFLPTGLSVFYYYGGLGSKQASFSFFYAFLALITLSAVIAVSLRYTKMIVFGVLFYVITLAPTLQLIPTGAMIVANHYAYIPLLGICYIAAEGFGRLYALKTKHSRLLRAALLVAVAAAVSFLFMSTWNRTKIWKDSISLWSDCLRKYPHTTRAYLNRGERFLKQKEYEKAARDFNDAIKSGYATFQKDGNSVSYATELLYAMTNLANVYLSTGKTEDAIKTLEKARDLNPHSGIVYLHLAVLYYSIGDTESAVASCKKAIEKDPFNAVAYDKLGILYNVTGDKDQARAMFSKAIEINPGYVSAYRGLASVYEKADEKDKLISLYRKAITNNLDFFDAYFYMGNVYSDAGDDKKALVVYKRAARIDPDSVQAYANLGKSYCILGRYKDALVTLNAGLARDPNVGVVHNNLALVYYYQRKYALALEHCDKAIKLGYPVGERLLDLLKPYRKQK